MVIWIIGMSAAGKTTLGENLYNKVRGQEAPWVFLDGDTFRNILGGSVGHSIEERRKNAYCLSRFCQFLNSQGINVIACVLSNFPDNRKFNRCNIPGYKEIFISVDFDKLVQRDNKELYKNAMLGKIKNVVGVDIDFVPPACPDYIVDNNANNIEWGGVVNAIIKEFNVCSGESYPYTKKNLLINPEKYQYSRFEGAGFLYDWEQDRKSALTYLEKKKSPGVADPLCTDDVARITLVDGFILKNFLLDLIDGDELLLSEKYSIFKNLIKRFEVSKKLYYAYSAGEVKKISDGYAELINYPLFSLVAQKYCLAEARIEGQMVFLNAALKVNDIISSAKERFSCPAEVGYALRAINGELGLIRSLM